MVNATEQSDGPKLLVGRFFDGIIFCCDIGHRSRYIGKHDRLRGLSEIQNEYSTD